MELHFENHRRTKHWRIDYIWHESPLYPSPLRQMQSRYAYTSLHNYSRRDGELKTALINFVELILLPDLSFRSQWRRLFSQLPLNSSSAVDGEAVSAVLLVGVRFSLSDGSGTLSLLTSCGRFERVFAASIWRHLLLDAIFNMLIYFNFWVSGKNHSQI